MKKYYVEINSKGEKKKLRFNKLLTAREQAKIYRAKGSFIGLTNYKGILLPLK